MFSPKISIVIPVYNGSNYIAEAIESALAQTYKNTEIIVVNDGSSDDGATERAIEQYKDKVRYFYKENGGVASALNFAIKQMTGDYFSWLSHDDLYLPEKLEKQITALALLENKNIVLYSSFCVFEDTPSNITSLHLKGVPAPHFRYWLTVGSGLHGCTLLIPRLAFLTVGLFNENLKTTQDYDLWFRMAETYPFIHLPGVLVQARSHSEQGTHQMKAIVVDECNDLLINFINSLSTNEIKAATKKSLGASYQLIAISMARRGYSRAEGVAKELMEQHKEKAILRGLTTIGSQYMHLLKRIKNKLNVLYVKHKIKSLPQHNYLKDKFSEVYDKNLFLGKDSRSGEGSNLVQTQVIRQEIPALLKELNIKTMLDAPCGDWHWMRETELPVEQYIGIDIVDTMIKKNQVSYGSDKVKFMVQDLTTSTLPGAELIFSRDCLVHLSFQDALKVIANFKRTGARYLLTTTFVKREENNDLGDGFWRPLNKQLAPFNFPPPLAVINEACTEGNNNFQDKSLGLWLLQDIDCTVAAVD